MRETPAHSRAPWLLSGLLALAAVVSVGTYLAFPDGSRQQSLASEALVAGSCFLAGGIILRAIGKGHAWRGGVHIAGALFLLGAANAGFLIFGIEPGRYVPGPADLAFL